jgi:hypothetical protein
MGGDQRCPDRFRTGKLTWPVHGNPAVATCSRSPAALDATPRDWARFTRQAVQFHLRNAAWANASTGEDLATQVDPDFVLGPAALAAPVG